MEHPFISSLSDKTLEELQASITDLNNKLSFAYRMQNSSMINQLLMVLDSYKTEHSRKMDALLKKQGDKTKINIEKES
jgi:hypothetical protein